MTKNRLLITKVAGFEMVGVAGFELGIICAKNAV